MTRIAILLVIVALVAGLYLAGGVDLLGDSERARDALTRAGMFGPLLYVIGFALLEPFSVPVALFVIPASLVWPTWQAFLLSWAGALGSAVVGFALGRWVARDWVQARLPGRVKRYDERLAERAFATVVVIRLVFFAMSSVHWALGVSKVRFTPFLLGSAVGLIPGIVFLMLLGKGLGGWLASQPPSVWGVALFTAAALGAGWWSFARRAGGAQFGASDG